MDYLGELRGVLKDYSLTNKNLLNILGWGELETKKTTGWVGSCINTWGNYNTKAKFRLYEDIGGVLKERLEHPFLDVLAKPNEFQTDWELKYHFSTYLSVFGNYYILKLRNGLGTPEMLVMLDASRMKPVQEKVRFKIDYYEYNTGKELLKLLPQDIIHFRYPSSESKLTGEPLIDAILDQISVDQYQTALTKQFYKAGGFAGAMFSTDAKLEQKQFDRALAQLKQRFGGAVEDQFKVALFEQGLQPIKSAYSIKDMDITGQRNLTKQEVIQAFRIPEILLGGSNQSYTKATAEAGEFVYCKTFIDPMLTYIDSVFTRHVKNDFGDKWVVKHDTVAPTDVAQNLQYYKDMISIGALTINEVRMMEDFDKFTFPLADASLINVGGALVDLKEEEQIGAVPNNVVGDQPSPNEDVEDDKSFDSEKLDLHWKQFDRRLRKELPQFEEQVKDFFTEQKQRLLNHLQLKEDFRAELFFAEEEMLYIMDLIENGYMRFLERGFSFSGAQKLEMLAQGMKDQFKLYSRNINETSKKKLLEAGELTKEKIDEIFKQFEETRVSTIAETTAVSGFNAGLFVGYQVNGYKNKIWVSQMDDRVRDAHAMANGQKVKLMEYFLVGSDLMLFPGDSTASPENVINCRCTILGEK